MRLFYAVCIALGAALLLLAGGLSSWQGVLAAALGVVGTSVFLGGTWIIVKLVGATASIQGPTTGQAALTVVALLLKLPLIYVGWVFAQGLGPMAPMWFLLGLALVYCAVIWRAVLATRE